mmetsp:Transcript_25358/g.39767  ORF Transcript_25358/g.39767 Transcript_25358/m.39767 type:complete len:291 (-) Transcript_25358:2203-3075(-)
MKDIVRHVKSDGFSLVYEPLHDKRGNVLVWSYGLPRGDERDILEHTVYINERVMANTKDTQMPKATLFIDFRSPSFRPPNGPLIKGGFEVNTKYYPWFNKFDTVFVGVPKPVSSLRNTIHAHGKAEALRTICCDAAKCAWETQEEWLHRCNGSSSSQSPSCRRTFTKDLGSRKDTKRWKGGSRLGNSRRSGAGSPCGTKIELWHSDAWLRAHCADCEGLRSGPLDLASTLSILGVFYLSSQLYKASREFCHRVSVSNIELSIGASLSNQPNPVLTSLVSVLLSTVSTWDR